MRNDLVGNFMDSCEFSWLDPKDSLRVLGRFMAVCKIGKLNPGRTASLIADFTDSCESNGLDPKDGLVELNAQDWDDPESKSDPISEEQLKEINRLMGLIVGEPTNERLEAIFRSVMLPAAN